MYDSKIELCNGFTAYFNVDENVYFCNVPLLGREVRVKLCGGDYDETEIEGLKTLFDRFWNDKDNIFKQGQKDIKEKLLPYMAKKKTNGLFDYPIMSEDDFDADYWLTLVQIAYAEDLWNEVHLFFGKPDDEEQDELCVVRDLDTGRVTFVAGSLPIDDI